MKIIKDMNWDRLTAISSVVIAGLAMYSSYVQGEANREHNKLSVRPMLYLERNVDTDAGDYSVYVNNNGLGPAITKELTFIFNGKPMDRDELLVNLGLNLDCFNRGAVHRTYRPADRQMMFDVLEDKEGCKVSKKELSDKFKKISVEIVYESLYGERMELEEPLY